VAMTLATLAHSTIAAVQAGVVGKARAAGQGAGLEDLTHKPSSEPANIDVTSVSKASEVLQRAAVTTYSNAEQITRSAIAEARWKF
jgi:hypothetical protein